MRTEKFKMKIEDLRFYFRFGWRLPFQNSIFNQFFNLHSSIFNYFTTASVTSTFRTSPLTYRMRTSVATTDRPWLERVAQLE
jgi:hypothetical protein